MTQELISNMLGVRREGVTEAAGKLQAAGLVDYRRGRHQGDRPGGPRGTGLRVLSGRAAEDGAPPAMPGPLGRAPW